MTIWNVAYLPARCHHMSTLFYVRNSRFQEMWPPLKLVTWPRQTKLWTRTSILSGRCTDRQPRAFVSSTSRGTRTSTRSSTKKPLALIWTNVEFRPRIRSESQWSRGIRPTLLNIGNWGEISLKIFFKIRNREWWLQMIISDDNLLQLELSKFSRIKLLKFTQSCSQL